MLRRFCFILIVCGGGFLFFSVLPCFAGVVDTAWVRKYSSPGYSQDGVSGIAVDTWGNVYVTGGTYSGSINNTALCTIKYLSDGTVAWIKTDDGDTAYATAIALDGSGNIYVTGKILSSSGTYLLTIKYYPNGTYAWARVYPDAEPSHNPVLGVDSSGNAYIGATIQKEETGWDYLAIKYYPNGDTAWVRWFDNGYLDELTDIAIDKAGNVYVAGSSGVSGYQNYCTIKYNANGSQAWINYYNGSANMNDNASGIALDDSGNAYVTGMARETSVPWPTDDFVTIKYYPDGNTAWIKKYNGFFNMGDWGRNISVDHSGNFIYAVGTVDNAISIIRYYSDGEIAWIHSDWPVQSGYIDYVVVDKQGNAYVAGTTRDANYKDVLLTMKYDSTGNMAWARIYNSPEAISNNLSGLAIDDSENVYATGSLYINPPLNYDYVTIKYSTFPSGDVNGDGVRDIGDIVFLINYVFYGGPQPNLIESGDCNCDGVVDIGDIVFMINYVFYQGEEPC
jgi:hypothetical protein